MASRNLRIDTITTHVIEERNPLDEHWKLAGMNPGMRFLTTHQLYEASFAYNGSSSNATRDGCTVSYTSRDKSSATITLPNENEARLFEGIANGDQGATDQITQEEWEALGARLVPRT